MGQISREINLVFICAFKSNDTASCIMFLNGAQIDSELNPA